MKRISPWAGAAMAAVVAVACAKDPSKEVPAAKVEDPKPAEPAAAAPAKAEPAKAEAPKVEPPKADPAAVAAPAAAAPAAEAWPGIALGGTIQATGSKVSGSHTMVFKQWRGAAELKDGKGEGGSLRFEVQMASLSEEPQGAMSGKFEGHMKNEDFFDVARFPIATFQSTAITAGGDAAAAGTTHTVKGNLVLRGVSKEVSFPATIAVAGKDITAKAAFSINRKDFGIAYAGMPDDLIRDGVALAIDVKGAMP